MVRKPGGKQSAGLLMFRRSGEILEVLLGHPGGPFWFAKDEGAWTIPKGLIGSGETALAAAKREFAEETGHRPKGKLRPLGEARQPGGKIVHVFAIENDWDPAKLKSNTFEVTWPPRARSVRSYPELDRAAWFNLGEARLKILKGQAVFLDRLAASCNAADW
jgi:predicted NUDIX family NTP pyrophosphohydrolase